MARVTSQESLCALSIIDMHDSLILYSDHQKAMPHQFLEEDFTGDNGLLTQTMKLKRRPAIERYKNLIDSLYSRNEVD